MVKQKIKKILYGFTLVELIIVITILSILATIAFVSFSGYNKNSRDSNRLMSIKQIEKGLELFSINTGKYPYPDGNIETGKVNGVEIMHTGEIGENISNLLKITGIPKDPLIGENYKYGITFDQKEYNIGGIFEGEITGINIINKTYAQDLKIKINGNYKGYISYNSSSGTYLTNIPSLIYSYSGVVNDIFIQKNEVDFLINNETYNPQTQNKKLTTDEKIQFKTNNSNTKLENININDFKNSTDFKQDLTQKYGNGDELNNLLASFGVEKIQDFEKIVKQKPLEINDLSKYNCGNTKDGESKTFWKIANVNYGQVCEDGVEFLCENGEWKNQLYNKNDYPIETQCIVGVPKNCEVESINGYSLIAKNHNEVQTSIKNDTNFLNGVKNLSQDFICDNGEYKTTGQEKQEITSCGIDYYLNNNQCENVGVGFYSESNSLIKNTCTNKPLNTIFTTSGNGSDNCSYTCSEGYYLSGGSCVSQWSGNQTTGFVFKNTSGVNTYPTSCNELLTNNNFKKNSNGGPWNGVKYLDGNYYIKPNQAPEFLVYCDMTNDGGGWTRYLSIKGNYSFNDAMECWKGSIINNGTLSCFNPNRYNMSVGKFMIKTPWHSTTKLTYHNPGSTILPNTNQYTTRSTQRRCLGNSEYMTLMTDGTNPEVTYANSGYIRLGLNFCGNEGINGRNVGGRDLTLYMNYSYEGKKGPIPGDRESIAKSSEIFIK